MTDTRWCRPCAVVLLLGLAFGLLLRGDGMNGAAMNAAVSMAADCGDCDGSDKDGSCPAAFCVLCPALLPAALALPNIGTKAAPVPAEERGHGLALRPHPPPPRPLLRA